MRTRWPYAQLDSHGFTTSKAYVSLAAGILLLLKEILDQLWGVRNEVIKILVDGEDGKNRVPADLMWAEDGQATREVLDGKFQGALHAEGGGIQRKGENCV